MLQLSSLLEQGFHAMFGLGLWGSPPLIPMNQVLADLNDDPHQSRTDNSAAKLKICDDAQVYIGREISIQLLTNLVTVAHRQNQHNQTQHQRQAGYTPAFDRQHQGQTANENTDWPAKESMGWVRPG